MSLTSPALTRSLLAAVLSFKTAKYKASDIHLESASGIRSSKLSLKASPGTLIINSMLRLSQTSRIVGVASDELAGHTGKAPNPSPGSDTSPQSAKEWLSTRHTCHTFCPTVSDGFIPRRILKIESNEISMSVHLVDTNSKGHTKWVALSYV